MFDHSYFERFFLQQLPRHVGIMYSTNFINSCLINLNKFKKTFHLYAAPFILGSIKNSVTFFDYPLFYFSINNNNGGAWHNKAEVFDGLLKFLIELRCLISEDKYKIAKEGFLKNYLGQNSWLRLDIEKNGLILKSESEIINLL